ncbi:hypothetical protein, variant 2 [Aphanomyces astaci]|uniref:Uncharacterized protein n=1 Tax=Aphanomyces astaci TaxID=112090 RepID=W4FF16_APHAT|nr:hypothetical protein, variant 2 [Aphanomyces astaci]ETV65484.1 hypothetical protein, variant 2 [Aphanomyces astaci]|eukprot:XP_009844972.1 hypothetical protein, variant 2 [Aphanomyces astaci]
MTATRTPHPAVCVGLQERLPAFMDAMNDFQYIQAKELIPSELGDVHEWKRIAKLLHFWADCDSTYHKTTFINKAQDDSTNPLARLYAELAKLSTSELLFVHQNHKGNADVDRFGRVKTPKARQSIDAPSFDLTLQLQAHDLTAFLQQCSVLFEHRQAAVSLYVALMRDRICGHHLVDFYEQFDTVAAIIQHLNTLSHPLLTAIRDMALLEVGAVRAAIECEMAISDFEYIKAITTLHRLKRCMHEWSDGLNAIDDDDDNHMMGSSSASSPRLSDDKPRKITPLKAKKGTAGDSPGYSSAHSMSSIRMSLDLLPTTTTHDDDDDDTGIIVLPRFCWARRWQQSLVRKFSLYFYKWLYPFDHPPQHHLNMTFKSSSSSLRSSPVLDILEPFFSKHFKEQDVATMTIIINTDSLPHNGATFHCHGYLCPAHVEKPDPSVAVKQHIRAANKTYFGQVSRYDEDVNGEFAAPWGVGTWPAVFSYPKPELDTSLILKHWPNLIMLLTNLPPWDEHDGAKLHHSKPMYYIYIYSFGG